MANVTRKIGLSLGADICWPLCYVGIMQKMALSIPWQGDDVGIEVERVSIEAFGLREVFPPDSIEKSAASLASKTPSPAEHPSLLVALASPPTAQPPVPTSPVSACSATCSK